MTNIKHPHGNIRSLILKSNKSILQKIIRFFTSFFCKLNDDDEIIISSATHAPWKKDISFDNFYKKIQDLTLLDCPRAYTLWYFSNFKKREKGLILDIGCLQGGSGFLMSKNNQNGKTLMFDSFSGFKKDDGLHKKEIFFYDDIDFVKKKIKDLKLKKTYVYKGYFPTETKVTYDNIKLCHIDVNTYLDAKKVFLAIEKKIKKNGIIIFDDFGIWGVDGIKKLIYELEKKFYKKFIFVNNYMGQSILIKK